MRISRYAVMRLLDETDDKYREIDANLEQIRDYIRQQCVERTQKAYADELGITPQYMNDLVAGRRNVSRELLDRMREAERKRK